MVEKLILDKNIIYNLTKRKDEKLLIQYNKQNKTKEHGSKLNQCSKENLLILLG